MQERLKQESLKESGLRIVEAEEAVKLHEERHQKELKRVMKQAEKLLDDARVKESQRAEDLVKGHQSEIRELQDRMRAEVESLKAEMQQMRIKMAEQNVTLKNDQQEINRLMKDNERMCESYKKLQGASKEDIKRLEAELRKKLEEGDKKVRD